MKPTNRIIRVVVVISAVFFMLACSETQMLHPDENYGSGTGSGVGHLWGSTQGTMSAKYDVFWENEEVTPVCTDDKADYYLFVSQDNELPANTNLSPGDIPSGEHYFYLDVYAAAYMVDEGECDYDRDRSDLVTHYFIEGSNKDYTYTLLSCGSSLEKGEYEIYHTEDIVVNGNITCKQGDQITLVFTFANMVIHNSQIMDDPTNP